VKVLEQERQGLTAALIRGCRAAKAELIARHDAGDWSAASRLRKQADLLRRDTNLSLVSCWYKTSGPQGETLWESRPVPDPEGATERFMGRVEGPIHGTTMFRRQDYEKVGGYRWQFYFAQDGDLWMRLLEVGKMAYVPELLYGHRLSLASLSLEHRDLQRTLAAQAERCRDARLTGESEDDILAAASRLRPAPAASAHPRVAASAYFIGRCLLARRDPRAGTYFRLVLRERPLHAVAWWGLVASRLFRSRQATRGNQ
jgi:hypothetical protein